MRRAESTSAAGGGTDVGCALRRVPFHAPRRGIVLLLSDLRDAQLRLDGSGGTLEGELAHVARRHDLVASVLHDPREDTLPNAGPLRLEDPEQPGRRALLDSSSRRVRERYHAACQARRHGLERLLRRRGLDVLWMRTDRDPLGALLSFFQSHPGRARVAP